MSSPRPDVGEPADRPAEPIDLDRPQAPPVTYRIVTRVAAALVVVALAVLVLVVVRADVIGWVGGVVHQYYEWLGTWFPLL
jgi:hypothetical protein